VLRDDAALRDWLDREPVDVATLALDVDVLDPSLLRSVAAPVPDGWCTDDVLGVVRALRRSGKRVARLSVAEFSPTPGDDADIDAMRLVHLLLRAIDEIVRP
jgi:arginase family enzyme